MNVNQGTMKGKQIKNFFKKKKKKKEGRKGIPGRRNNICKDRKASGNHRVFAEW